MGKGEREDSNQNRRQITLHSFRRFVKTTISDLGYFDFSEYFIGHIGSTYWRKKDSEKAEIYRKIEPYLTFLLTEPLICGSLFEFLVHLRAITLTALPPVLTMRPFSLVLWEAQAMQN